MFAVNVVPFLGCSARSGRCSPATTDTNAAFLIAPGTTRQVREHFAPTRLQQQRFRSWLCQLTVFRDSKGSKVGKPAATIEPTFAQVLGETAPTGEVSDFVVYDADGRQHPLIDVVEHYGKEDADMKGTLIIWPRHFGCILCRRMVKELASHEQAFRSERKWRLMVVGCGTPEQAAKFRSDPTLGPLPTSIQVFTDPLRRSYLALRFRRGILSTFNLPALQRILDSYRKGERQRWDMIPPDAFQQGGIALVERDTGALCMLYRSQYAGDTPNAATLLHLPI